VPRLLELFAAAAPGFPRDDYAAALLALDPVQAAPVVCRLTDPMTASYNHARIAHAGAFAGDPESIAFLERAAAPGSRIRDKAIETLALVKGGAMFEQLAAAAADPSSDDFVRGQAVAGLRRLRDPRAFEAYVAALHAGSHAAATALAELGDPRAVDALVAKAREVDHYYQRDSTMKAAVLDALGALGVLRDDVWDVLGSLLESSSDHIREHAALACQRLRPGWTLRSRR
jgi:HEAT repeat protein